MWGVTWVKLWRAVCPQEPWARLSCCSSGAALVLTRHGAPPRPLADIFAVSGGPMAPGLDGAGDMDPRGANSVVQRGHPCVPAAQSPHRPTFSSLHISVPYTPVPPRPCTPGSIPHTAPPPSPHSQRLRGPAHSAETSPITRLTQPLAPPILARPRPFKSLCQWEARRRAAPPPGARPPCTVSMERGASHCAHALWSREPAAPRVPAQAAGSETPWGNPRWGESGAGPVEH